MFSKRERERASGTSSIWRPDRSRRRHPAGAELGEGQDSRRQNHSRFLKKTVSRWCFSLSLSFSFYFFSSFFLFPVCCVWYYVIRQALATTSFSLFLLPNTSASLAAQDTIDRHERTGGVKKKKRANKLLIKYKKTDTAQSFLSFVNSNSDRARLSPLLKRCRKDFCQLFFVRAFQSF